MNESSVPLHENRIINGVLKTGVMVDPQVVKTALASDVAIIAPPERANSRDLWPCIWALAAVLERQFTGTVSIDCGLEQALSAPTLLGARCVFGRAPKTARHIFIGAEGPNATDTLWGDVRENCLGCERLVASRDPAHPVSCFALAGYLGFAALARAVGIPPYREAYRTDYLHLPLTSAIPPGPLSLSVIGLGHLGQAYLALLYFVCQNIAPTAVLIDRDSFEPPNRATQILLEETFCWNGVPKHEYLERLVQQWGWHVRGRGTTLEWGWRRPIGDPTLTLLGLDDLDVRRMAIAAGYEWIIDAGLGASFLQPRISWHALPPDNRLARSLFTARRHAQEPLDVLEGTPLKEELSGTPGECGWLTFQSITAAVPSMGLAGAAFAITELLNSLSGNRASVSGRACLWSTILPMNREHLTV
jgi:hypothetical protein